MGFIDTIFFDIGETLASPVIDDDDRLLSVTPLPGARDTLARLRDAGYRLGIISNTGTETSDTMRQSLTKGLLFEFFAAEPQLLIYSSEVHLLKDSPEIFRLACQRAERAATPQRCMFVGENTSERKFAAEAGMAVAATPAEAVHSVCA